MCALKLAGLPIPRDQLHQALLDACTANRLIADDGLTSVEATIRSAFRKADTDGPRTVPDPTPLGEVYELPAPENKTAPSEPGAAGTPPGGGGEAPDNDTPAAPDPEAMQRFRQQVINKRVFDMGIEDEARTVFAAQQAALLGQARPHPIPLPDMLAVPDEDATYRIIDLLPTGGNVLLAAQQKAGKTSMIANLLRALVDGGNFLGKFPADPVGRITLIDNELDERMLRRWLRDQGIIHADRVHVVSLKGRIATFDINNPHVRAEWANDLRGSDFVILDCLRPCLDALGLSEDKDAGRFLVSWDALKKEAGVDETIVVHHMGHSQERSRGDSRLLDWPDVNWRIIKEAQSEDANPEEVGADGGKRFFSAHGRDVMVAEGLLGWSPEARRLTYLGGGRREAKAVGAVEAIRAILSDPDCMGGLGTVALTAKLHDEGIGKPTARAAIKKAVQEGVLIEMSGHKNAKILTLNPSEVAR